MGSQLSLGAGQRQGASLGVLPTHHSEHGGARVGASCSQEGLESAEGLVLQLGGGAADSGSPSPLSFPPRGHMPTASHQVLTPQFISKEPALPAEPTFPLSTPSGVLGMGCQGKGSGSWEGTPLTCFHLTGWLLVSEES